MESGDAILICHIIALNHADISTQKNLLHAHSSPKARVSPRSIPSGESLLRKISKTFDPRDSKSGVGGELPDHDLASRIALLTCYRNRNFRMPSRRFSIILFSALVLVTVVLGAPNLLLLPGVAATSRTISLVGVVSSWNSTSTPNPTITLTQGDGVTLQLSSGDGVLHRWFVDVDKNGPTPDCPGADICSNAFTTSTVLTFTVNFAPGTYTYYCSVHPTTMLGQFVVNPSSSVGGTAQPVDRLAVIAPYLGVASALAILVTVAGYTARTRRKKEKE